mmetsp:Transcript_52728/g.140679  ORF Transcript_52728/g.140679 Transcript_52728/m.140679 type:complete len:277 (+) Transcript_52728:758-1588(+)
MLASLSLSSVDLNRSAASVAPARACSNLSPLRSASTRMPTAPASSFVSSTLLNLATASPADSSASSGSFRAKCARTTSCTASSSPLPSSLDLQSSRSSVASANEETWSSMLKWTAINTFSASTSLGLSSDARINSRASLAAAKASRCPSSDRSFLLRRNCARDNISAARSSVLSGSCLTSFAVSTEASRGFNFGLGSATTGITGRTKPGSVCTAFQRNSKRSCSGSTVRHGNAFLWNCTVLAAASSLRFCDRFVTSRTCFPRYGLLTRSGVYQVPS